MKYSIRGQLKTNDGKEVIQTLSKYVLWKLDSRYSTNDEKEYVFDFEVWLETITEKTLLFNELKPFVNSVKGYIEWHECYNDGIESIPCEIAERYEVI